MSRCDSYNTKQKDNILCLIKSYNHDFTIKNIYDDLKGSAGLTTIYRFIDKLILNGVVDKYIGHDNVTYYSYLEKCNEDNHFYLRCSKCGKMIHVDCDCIGDLSSHVFSKHNFKINQENIIINGICEDCCED